MNEKARALRDLRRAIALYKAFREQPPPRRARIKNVNLPRAVAPIGTVEFIGYMTSHRRKVVLYVHDFAPGSRPTIFAGAGRNQLYLFDGRFKVTARGITDLDARGREIDYSPRYLHKKRGFKGTR